MVLDDSYQLLLIIVCLFIIVCFFLLFSPQEFIASLPLPNGSLLPPSEFNVRSGAHNTTRHILRAYTLRGAYARYVSTDSSTVSRAASHIPTSGVWSSRQRHAYVTPQYTSLCCRFDLARTWHLIVVRLAQSGT